MPFHNSKYIDSSSGSEVRGYANRGWLAIYK